MWVRNGPSIPCSGSFWSGCDRSLLWTIVHPILVPTLSSTHAVPTIPTHAHPIAFVSSHVFGALIVPPRSRKGDPSKKEEDSNLPSCPPLSLSFASKSRRGTRKET